ncbi:MAG: hypothetical protein H7Y43_09510 [Akkermansiaceae bacterium]|nr:hypothetical protein [Verrucomicrobiales bacterium]
MNIPLMFHFIIPVTHGDRRRLPGFAKKGAIYALGLRPVPIFQAVMQAITDDTRDKPDSVATTNSIRNQSQDGFDPDTPVKL